MPINLLRERASSVRSGLMLGGSFLDAPRAPNTTRSCPWVASNNRYVQSLRLGPTRWGSADRELMACYWETVGAESNTLLQTA